MDPSQLPAASKIIALLGRADELHSLVLESLFLRAVRGERVGVIVGDNRLDAYTLARRARVQGFDPVELLARVELSREFTCYQLHHCIATLDTTRTDHWSALYVLGYLDTFYDEDVKYPEARRLLRTGLTRLKAIAMSGLPILVTLAPPREPGREDFVDLVLHVVDAYWIPPPAVVARVAAEQLCYKFDAPPV